MNAVEKLFGYGPMTLDDVPFGARERVSAWIRERGLADDPPAEAIRPIGRASDAEMMHMVTAALDIISWHLRSGQRDGLGRLHRIVEALDEEAMHRLVEAHPEMVKEGKD